MIFNHPEECLVVNGVVHDPVTGDVVTNCNEPDLFVEAVGGAVINASGAISASNGKLKTNGKPAGGGVVNTTFELNAGEGAVGDNQPCCFGVLEAANGNGADVHIVVAEHLMFASWPVDLTTPKVNHRGAVFVPL